MSTDLRDEDILIALDGADEEEQALLVLALGESTGEQGAPFLRRLVRAPVPGELELSALALTPFAERCGSEATPELLEKFITSGRKIDTQRWLLYLLARYADDRAGDAVLAWLTRRLRSERRGRDGDQDDIPLAITYLAQHPICVRLLEAAGNHLLGMWSELVKDERLWLSRHWSALATDWDATQAPLPPPTEVEVERMLGWLAQTSFFQSRVLPQHVQEILERRGPSPE